MNSNAQGSNARPGKAAPQSPRAVSRQAAQAFHDVIARHAAGITAAGQEHAPVVIAATLVPDGSGALVPCGVGIGAFENEQDKDAFADTMRRMLAKPRIDAVAFVCEARMAKIDADTVKLDTEQVAATVAALKAEHQGTIMATAQDCIMVMIYTKATQYQSINEIVREDGKAPTVKFGDMVGEGDGGSEDGKNPGHGFAGRFALLTE